MDGNRPTNQQCRDAISKALTTCPDEFLDFVRERSVTDDPAGDFVGDTQVLARVHGDKWHQEARSRLYSANDDVRIAGGVIALEFFAHQASK